MLLRAYLAEFLASILVVYVVLETGNSLAIGAAYALGRILAAPLSGGHINPLITVALASGDYFPIMEILPYVVSQILGGILAVHVYKNYRL